MKKACLGCGFDIFVEEHHPDVKSVDIVVRKFMDNIIELYDYSDEKYDELKKDYGVSRLSPNGYISIEKRHKNPDDWKYLCPNCHTIVTKLGIPTVKKLRNLYKRRDILEKMRINIFILEKDENVLLITEEATND